MNVNRRQLKDINYRGKVIFNADLKRYSSFKTGGYCPALFIPEDPDDLITLLEFLDERPLILGDGANILFSDRGTDKYIINTALMKSIESNKNKLICGAGASVTNVCKFALKKKLSGMEFIYGMPGSVGGAVWMNARCYGKSIEDVLDSVSYLDETNKKQRYEFNPEDFSYKKSPFQNKDYILLHATFKLALGHKKDIKKEMKHNINDRRKKGHFRFPCAGSVFKNNRDFGMPSGKIIDKCGLKGLQHGRARIAPYHGNIIINLGGASSESILYLIEKTEQIVFEKTGFRLEREIQLAGNWDRGLRR